jgi:hypothetical protein
MRAPMSQALPIDGKAPAEDSPPGAPQVTAPFGMDAVKSGIPI